MRRFTLQCSRVSGKRIARNKQFIGFALLIPLPETSPRCGEETKVRGTASGLYLLKRASNAVCVAEKAQDSSAPLFSPAGRRWRQPNEGGGKAARLLCRVVWLRQYVYSLILWFKAILSPKPKRLFAGIALAFLGVWLAFAGPALAVNPDEMLKDPALEARARHLSAQLRCMVCQNQSIDDSNAELARDLRVLVRERIVKGDSDDDVMRYLVSRYGDFVLLKPRLTPETVILWTAPGALLLIGAGAAFAYTRRRKSLTGSEPLSAEEEARLQRLLEE